MTPSLTFSTNPIQVAKEGCDFANSSVTDGSSSRSEEENKPPVSVMTNTYFGQFCI